MANRTSLGCDDESAFRAAVAVIGEAAALRSEFAKVSEAGHRSTHILKQSCRVAGLFMLLINTWTLLESELSRWQQLLGILIVTIVC